MTTAARTWWDDLYEQWLDPDPHWQRDWPFVKDWLHLRYDLVLRLQPKVIVEIGVRAGYGAFAMLSAAPTATYLGIDSYHFPGYSDKQRHLPHARKLLERFPSAFINVMDSQKLAKLPCSHPDLVHVDGEHSESGCYRDCKLAYDAGAKWILVDDTTGIDIVRAGAQRFVTEHRLPFEDVDPGQQGAWLIDCQRATPLVQSA